MDKIKQELGIDQGNLSVGKEKSKESDDSLNMNVNNRRFFELNRQNNMTTINESDERMINESCEFSETSILENPIYKSFRASLDKSRSRRNTGEKERSITRPFEKVKNGIGIADSATKKNLTIALSSINKSVNEVNEDNEDSVIYSNDNTIIEFESFSHMGSGPINLKKLSDKDLKMIEEIENSLEGVKISLDDPNKEDKESTIKHRNGTNIIKEFNIKGGMNTVNTNTNTNTNTNSTNYSTKCITSPGLNVQLFNLI